MFFSFFILFMNIATTAESGAIAGIVIGTICAFLLFVCCPITICVVIAYRRSKRSSSRTSQDIELRKPAAESASSAAQA